MLFRLPHVEFAGGDGVFLYVEADASFLSSGSFVVFLLGAFFHGCKVQWKAIDFLSI
jgi:hypothetical protein